jgi:hypothetical protein
MRRAAALFLILGCARKIERQPPSEIALACASACASLTRTCPADEPTERRQAHCVSACAATAEVARQAHCEAEHRAYLACVGRRNAACPPPSVAPAVTLENATGLSECRAEHERYFRCTEPCREKGVVWARTARMAEMDQQVEVHAEIVHAGCGTVRPEVARKSPAGSPCSHYSVCTPSQCTCPGNRAGFLARACVAGRCAESPRACSLAPQAVGHDPCGSTRP